MLYGYLPFWAESEEDFIDKIVTSPIKFDPNIPVTNGAKVIIKGMLHKEPEQRFQLMDVMGMVYFQMEEQDLEEEVKALEKELEKAKVQEEVKQEQSLNDDYIASLNLNAPSLNAMKKGNKSLVGKEKTPKGSIKVKKSTGGTTNVTKSTTTSSGNSNMVKPGKK